MFQQFFFMLAFALLPLLCYIYLFYGSCILNASTISRWQKFSASKAFQKIPILFNSSYDGTITQKKMSAEPSGFELCSNVGVHNLRPKKDFFAAMKL